MNAQQRMAAVDYVRNNHCKEGLIEVDPNVADSMTNFLTNPNGVWVKGWLWCPKDAVNQYEYPRVQVKLAVKPISFDEFSRRYKAILDSSCDEYTEEDIFNSWRRYQSEPAGHFIHRYPEVANDEEELARAKMTADKFGKEF